MNRIFQLTLFSLILYMNDAKVVVFFPTPATSHVRGQTNVARALADLGHVTWVCIPDYMTKNGKIDTSGIKVIKYGQSLGDLEEMAMEKTKFQESFFKNKTQGITVVIEITLFFDQLAMTVMAEGLYDKIKALNPDFFVIGNGPFAKTISTIPYKLGIPFGVDGTFHDVVSYRIPFSPAATPLQFGNSNDEMDFWGRLQSTLGFFIQLIQPKLLEFDAVSVFAPEKPYKTLSEIIASAEIFIVELDLLIDYPRPSLPNVKLVGGMSIEGAKPLKVPYKTFIENSNNGIILVTFGSTLSHIPDYIYDKINRACMSTGLNIIWRSEKPTPDPTRILTEKWVPQNDILGNKNTKLFISHCGKNGQYEALYNGVPILCLPLFGDQLYNAECARAKGYGLKADMRFVSVEDLSEIVRELVTNRTYKDTIVKASKLFRLLYKSPRKEAAFWLDHVIEFGGGYMRAASQKMPYYQFLMLDVFTCLFVAMSLIFVLWGVVIYCLCQCLLCNLRKTKMKSE